MPGGDDPRKSPAALLAFLFGANDRGPQIRIAHRNAYNVAVHGDRAIADDFRRRQDLDRVGLRAIFDRRSFRELFGLFDRLYVKGVTVRVGSLGDGGRRL